jgi:MFS family permease
MERCWCGTSSRLRKFLIIQVSYYLALVLETVGITSVTQQTLINGFLQLWNLIIAVTASQFVDRAGRRMLFFISTIGMLVSYIVITGLSGSFAQTQVSSVGLAVIPMLFIYYGSYDIAFTPLIVSYTAEIWPYALRARGLAVCLGSTFLALLFNLFVNPIALASIGWKYYIVYIIILIVILFTVFFFYPETRGFTLEEIARVFDGEHASVPHQGEVLETVRRKSGVDHVEIGH